MKHVRKSVLLWFSPRQIYDLVVAVEDYPRFLPWCADAQVLQRDADGMTARLTMKALGMRHSFTTRNDHIVGEEVRMRLVDGPFSELAGGWRFVPLDDGRACRVEFELRYAFSSATLAAVITPVFERVADTLVDSFVKRAEDVYGRGA